METVCRKPLQRAEHIPPVCRANLFAGSNFGRLSDSTTEQKVKNTFYAIAFS
jgi:hypothetical protein